MNDDVQVIERAKGGDQKAFTTIYEKYRRLLRLVIWDIVKNDDVADDLLSITFTKAFQNIHTYINYISFEMWLKKIASNTAIDYIRRMKEEINNQYVDSDDCFLELESQESNPETSMVKNEELGRLSDVLTLLRSDYRELITLRYLDELSYREIAELLDKPEGTIKSDLHKAKKRLAELYKN